VTLIDAGAALAEGAHRAARDRAAAAIGITREIVCGCAGDAPDSDFGVTSLNRRRRVLTKGRAGAAAWCAAVDARRPDHARDQIARASTRGAVAIDVFTGGADELALDLVVVEASRRGLPVRVADPAVLAGLVRAHARTEFVLSRPGDLPFTDAELAPFAAAATVHLDLASCGAVRGAIDAALARFGAERVLWGSGARMEVALAQLRALEVIAPGEAALDAIRWRNAMRLYKRLGGA